jgi:hypothetical protein
MSSACGRKCAVGLRGFRLPQSIGREETLDPLTLERRRATGQPGEQDSRDDGTNEPMYGPTSALMMGGTNVRGHVGPVRRNPLVSSTVGPNEVSPWAHDPRLGRVFDCSKSRALKRTRDAITKTCRHLGMRAMLTERCMAWNVAVEGRLQMKPIQFLSDLQGAVGRGAGGSPRSPCSSAPCPMERATTVGVTAGALY